MSDTIRIGLLRLSDAAPVLVAQEQGMFETQGLQVEISVEPSWANIADKLSYGMLEAAVMLPPLAMACMLGLRGRKTDLVLPLSLSANGNAVTLTKKWQEPFAAGGILAVANRQKLRLGVVHAFSTHDLLLRYWLDVNGLDPDRDVEIAVLSPAEMVGGLAAGAIDGFCAGAPWGHVALRAGLGFTAIKTQEIWEDHPEKCLALRADFAAGDPARVRNLLIALSDACRYCATRSRRPALAELLSRPENLDLPADLIEPSLNPAEGGPIFDQNFPVPAHGTWFAMQMLRWGKAPENVLGAASALYNPGLFIASGGAKPFPREEIFCDTKR
jgi:NitT/TauT family transport system ATP-binding protein/nitrate/nitrite transport system substrate-binding protein